MGIALGLGGLIMLIALLLKAQEKGAPQGDGKMLTENSPKPYAKGLPPAVKDVIVRHTQGQQPTRTELELAASAATVAGYTMLGEELLNQAKSAPERAPVTGFTSPFSEISHDAWTKFVKTMATNKAADSERGRYGAFQMGVRRLVDFDLMGNPQKTGDGTWEGDWRIDENKFLGDPALQYKVFSRSMANFRTEILDRYRSAVGTKLDGQPATLSGLLAVAHYTGIDGLGKWLGSPELRKKFKSTSAAYAKANGIF